MGSKKIAIVGAGIVGISSAINLARRGCDVTLIDRDFKGKPASYGNASWLSSVSITPVLMPGMIKKIPKLLFSKDGPLFLRFPGFLKIIPFLTKYLSYAKKEKVDHISKNLAYLLKDSVNEHKELAKGTKATQWIKDSPYFFIYKNKKDFLKDFGADVLEIPTIKIVPPSNNDPVIQSITGIGSYEWIIFTSPNGVTHFFDYM